MKNRITQIGIQLAVIILFTMFIAFLAMILWNLAVPFVFPGVNGVTYLQSFCLVALFNMISRSNVVFNT